MCVRTVKAGDIQVVVRLKCSSNSRSHNPMANTTNVYMIVGSTTNVIDTLYYEFLLMVYAFISSSSYPIVVNHNYTYMYVISYFHSYYLCYCLTGKSLVHLF